MEKTMKNYRKFIDEPNMSDKTLLMSVEDLINMAFGTMDQNVVNFKLVQTVLHILARQMRLLEQDVEIKFDEIGIEKRPADAYDEGGMDDQQYISSSAESRDEAESRGERGERGGKGERGQRGEKGERERQGGKSSSKDRDDKDGSKDTDKAGSKRRGDKGSPKEKDKGTSKERGGDRAGGTEADKGGKEKDKGRKGDRSKDRDEEGGGGRGGGRGGDRGADREDEQGGGRGGERGGGRGGEQGGGRGGEQGGGRAGGKGGEQGGAKGAEQGGGKGAEQGGGKGGQQGGGKGAQQGGGKGGQQAGGKGGQQGGGAGGRGADQDDGRTGGARDQGRGAERGGGKAGKRGADQRGGADTGRQGGRGKVGEQTSRTSITVSEAERRGGKGAQDKVLVVGKGPAAGRDRPARVGSIEVVTASQFALLEKAVKQLETVAGPLPTPALPDNEKLRKDLAKGTASLTETMQAMQLNARVQAAEEGLTRMASMLTQLAATGALPKEIASRIGDVRSEMAEAAQAAAAGGPGRGAGPGGVGMGPGGAGMGPGGAGMGADGAGRGPGGAGRGPGGAGAGHRGAGAGQGGPGTGYGASESGYGGAGTGYGGTSGAGGSGGPGSYGQGPRKSVGIDPSTLPASLTRDYAKGGGTSTPGATSSGGRASIVSGVSSAVSAGVGGSGFVGVTHPEMEDVLQILKDDLIKYIGTMTARALHCSEIASSTSKSVADKLDIALKLDSRINKLFSVTADYAEQLSGFDSGLTTQMASFQEQMSQMKSDLKGGLTQLENANNNAETAAIAELTERYECLVTELDNTLHTHQGLTILQKQLSDELRSLVECVEMLREQKADRDEVFDGLRDKADITRLAGLLHEEDFAHARIDLEKRLEMCYDKFNKQDKVWLGALKDLTGITEGKAEIMQLLSIKDNATEELKAIQETLRKLYVMLGEPKAAVLMRQLAKGAVCGSCLAPALMVPTDLNYGQPFPLPALRPSPLGQEGPCLTDLQPPPPFDTREHVCRRWVGGSHTLMSDNVTRERAPTPQLQTVPTKRFTGYGTDGRLYMLEEELLPCLECNKMNPGEPEAISTPLPTPSGGAGDQTSAKPTDSEKIVKDGTGDQ